MFKFILKGELQTLLGVFGVAKARGLFEAFAAFKDAMAEGNVAGSEHAESAMRDVLAAARMLGESTANYFWDYLEADYAARLRVLQDRRYKRELKLVV